MKKTALVCGAGGFIGHHLVKRLKSEGFWVRGVDLKKPEFSETEADEFILGDLRNLNICNETVDRPFDEVYQLAADMGGMGFIERFRVECLRSILVNTHLIEAAYRAGAQRYFFSSSACVYRDQQPDEPDLTEDDDIQLNEVYPADIDGVKHPIPTARIAEMVTSMRHDWWIVMATAKISGFEQLADTARRTLAGGDAPRTELRHHPIQTPAESKNHRLYLQPRNSR